jgi:hypothetical protein
MLTLEEIILRSLPYPYAENGNGIDWQIRVSKELAHGIRAAGYRHPDEDMREVAKLRDVMTDVLAMLENDFSRCPRCDHQENNAGRDTDAAYTLRAALKEQDDANA